jgi:hypothetical protein
MSWHSNYNISWKWHIGYIVSKVSRLIGIIAKLRSFVPVNGLINIYKSLILPHLTYGIVLWGQAAKCHIDKILKLQKRAIYSTNIFGTLTVSRNPLLSICKY